jgi:hypothetical protein
VIYPGQSPPICVGGLIGTCSQPTASVPMSTSVQVVPWWKTAKPGWIAWPCGSLPVISAEAHSFESIATL